ncbi:MAG: TonB-dependent receptor [Proteobacteria bacterium]|nr:TonB-dependent receptor [Pseudomonadota bacterium]
MRNCNEFRITVIAAAIAALPMTSQAQQNIDAPEKITVTATKREAVLTDVSLGISSLSEKTLEARGITSLEDLGANAPGMNIIKAGPGENLLVSRGISTTQSLSLQSGPAVGVYVDEMPLAGITSGVPDFGMWDVARVEMLRGPQGTLYGEGAMAGTIRIITAAPDSKKLSSKVQLTGSSVADGSAGQSLRGMLNVPISEGVAAVRATVSYNKDPSWIDAPDFGRKDVNTSKQTDARLALGLTPNSKLKIDASLWHQNSDAVHGNNQTSPGVFSPPALGVDSAGFSLLANHQLNTDSRNGNMANLTVKYDFGAYTLVSATSNAKQNIDTVQDAIDTAPYVFRVKPAATAHFLFDAGTGLTTRNRTLDMNSEELRLVSNGDQRFNWTVGGYFKKLDRHVNNNWLIIVPKLGINDNSLSTSDTSSDSKALFGEGDWKATDTVTLTAGLRNYSDDRKATFTVNRPSDLLSPLPAGVYATTSSEKQTTYNAIASWKPSDKLNVFARAASGFRAGGPNAWVQDPVEILVREFKAEKIQSLELGVKSNPTPWLVANAYVFNNDWKDKQIQLATVTWGFDYTANAATARAKGVEFEFQVYPAQGLSLNAAVTYTDATITSDLRTSTGKLIAASGSRLPYVAPWELKASADYRWSMNGGRNGVANLTYIHRNSNFSDITNAKWSDNGSLNQVNLRAGVESNKKSWGVFGFVKNLSNSQSVTTVQHPIGNNAGSYPNYLQPRTIGIELQAAY